MPQINPLQTGGGIVFATPAKLITKALKDIGVVGFGRVATAAEIEDGLETLNTLLDMWSVLRENVNVRREENFPLVANQGSYSIGVGSLDFDTTRPIAIEQAYYRDSQNSDFPIDCSMSEAEYSSISIKNLSGSPKRLFYKPDYPFGVIYFDFAPSTVWTLYIKSWKPFAKITDANDLASMSFPDGFESAILYNLEEMLCPPNKKAVHATVEKLATMSLQGIQAAYGEVLEASFDHPGVRQGRRGSFFDMGGGK